MCARLGRELLMLPIIHLLLLCVARVDIVVVISRTQHVVITDEPLLKLLLNGSHIHLSQSSRLLMLLG